MSMSSYNIIISSKITFVYSKQKNQRTNYDKEVLNKISLEY